MMEGLPRTPRRLMARWRQNSDHGCSVPLRRNWLHGAIDADLYAIHASRSKADPGLFVLAAAYFS